MKRGQRKEIICRCNSVARDTIETAIREGRDTLDKIFDATTAGVGPCGASCRRKLGRLLQAYLQTGKFPAKIVEDLTGRIPMGIKSESYDLAENKKDLGRCPTKKINHK